MTNPLKVKDLVHQLLQMDQEAEIELSLSEFTKQYPRLIPVSAGYDNVVSKAPYGNVVRIEMSLPYDDKTYVLTQERKR